MALCSACNRPLQLGRARCMYCGALAAPVAPRGTSAHTPVALPPGRPGPTVVERAARGGSPEVFAAVALRFLRERLGELTDASRVAAMNWIAAPSEHPARPYAAPDHELFFDVITTEGVGYMFRYAGADAHPVANADDPLFAPIQPPLPLSRVDLTGAALMLSLGRLREVVLVANVLLGETLQQQVARSNAMAVHQGGPAERQIRMVSFPWSPSQPDLWRHVARDAATSTGPSTGSGAATDTAGASPAEAALAATRAGNRLAEQGRLDDALRGHDEAIRLDAGCALAWCNRAYVLSLMRRFEAAQVAAERALALDDKLVQAWLNLSQVRLSLGDFPGALTASERGLLLAPRAAPLHFNAAVAADRTYKQPLAIAHYKSFVELASPAYQRELEHARQRLAIFRA